MLILEEIEMSEQSIPVKFSEKKKKTFECIFLLENLKLLSTNSKNTKNKEL